MDPATYLERRDRLRHLATVSLLPLGALMAFIGVTFGIACTSTYPFSQSCSSQDFLVPGYVIALVGACFALVGLASLLAHGKDAEPDVWAHAAESALPERVDRRSRLAFVGVVGAGIAAAEFVPMYTIALQTMGGDPPTFNPVFFAADLILFVVADLIALFALYQWTGSR